MKRRSRAHIAATLALFLIGAATASAGFLLLAFNNRGWAQPTEAVTMTLGLFMVILSIWVAVAPKAWSPREILYAFIGVVIGGLFIAALCFGSFVTSGVARCPDTGHEVTVYNPHYDNIKRERVDYSHYWACPTKPTASPQP